MVWNQLSLPLSLPFSFRAPSIFMAPLSRGEGTGERQAANEANHGALTDWSGIDRDSPNEPRRNHSKS